MLSLGDPVVVDKTIIPSRGSETRNVKGPYLPDSTIIELFESLLTNGRLIITDNYCTIFELAKT